MSSTHSSSKASSNGGASAADTADAVRASAGSKDAREKILGNMKNIIDEAENWLASSAAESGEELREVKEKFNVTLQTAKTDLLKIEANMLARTKLAAKSADAYVQDHPWQAVGFGAAIGLALGWLISRD